MSTLPAKYEEARRALAPRYRDQPMKSPPLTGKEVRALLASIAEWFPQAFVSEKYLPHRPLKIGIHVDLQARRPTLSERGASLHYYVTRTMYLRACVAGAPRIDLDGNVCGEVSAAEAQHAVARLAIPAARARKQELIKSRAAAKPAALRKNEKPPEEKPPPLQRDGLAALRGAAAKRRAVA